MKCNKDALKQYFGTRRYFTYRIAAIDISSESQIELNNSNYMGMIGINDDGYFRWKVIDFDYISVETMEMIECIYKTLEDLIKNMNKIIKEILKNDINIKIRIRSYRCGDNKFWNNFAKELRNKK